MLIPKKFPTLVGLLLLMLFVGVFVTAVEQSGIFRVQATKTETPTNVEVTNVTSSSFTISWTTEAPATGAIIVAGEGIKTQTVFDERDSDGRPASMQPFTTHSVTFRNAQPETLYRITILSAGKRFTQQGSPYSVKTGPPLSGSVNLEPAYGTVRTEDNDIAGGALVYLSLEGSQKLSGLVTPGGTWLIPLNLLRTQDLSAYISVSQRMTESILILLNGRETQAITDTLNDAPVPQMQLGKTYDFRHQQAAATVPATPETPSILGDTTGPAPSSFSVTLTKPAKDSAVATTLPLIQGTGIPGNTVAVTLGITKPVAGTTTVGVDGIFRYTPANSLDPGKQSVTITTVDANGKAVAITHMFEVLKSGTQVLGEATPSGTLVPTAPLSPSPTSTLAGQEIPTSGSILPTILLMLISIGLISSGAVLFVR